MMLCTRFGWIAPVVWRESFKKTPNPVYHSFLIISSLKWIRSSFEQNWKPKLPRISVQGVVQIGQVDLEKKILKHRTIFLLFPNNHPFEGNWSFMWTKVISPRMLCAKCWNWPNWPNENINVYDNNDDDNDRQLTNCDQKNSLEPVKSEKMFMFLCWQYPWNHWRCK